MAMTFLTFGEEASRAVTTGPMPLAAPVTATTGIG
jgi:hypothetical protein